MKLVFLGTGTSHGVPTIACNCKVCTSKNKKNKRNRSSVYITTDDNHHILIDVTPEFRIQALKYKISEVDEVLLTHSHADHLHGIDDLRIFSTETAFPADLINQDKYNKPPIPIYSSETTCEELKERFPYLFRQTKEGGGIAKISLQPVQEQFFIGKTCVTPIPMMHGHMNTTGWLLSQTDEVTGRKRSIAYLTDCSFISQESFELIQKSCGELEHLIIDGLRIKEHSTHFNYLQALEAADKIGCAKNIWITHMTHQVTHRETAKYLKNQAKNLANLQNAKVKPAWDGLIIKI